MKARALLAVADEYARLLEAHGVVVERADLNAPLNLIENRDALLNHARWQLEMVPHAVNRIGGQPVAIRLFAAAQALMVSSGLLTIAQTWSDNEAWLDGTSLRAFDAAMEEVAKQLGRNH